jgi:deazaflavin-dependent oxidoreductase (nitroreductase family)
MATLRDITDFSEFAKLPNANELVIEDFRTHEGRVGGPFEGLPVILVHHVGAKTGKTRVSPMGYFPQDDGSMIVGATNGGRPTNPNWYHNLKANPRIDVEVGTEKFPVVVEEIDGQDRTDAWVRIAAIAPGYADQRNHTSRTIPLLRLTRVD